MEDTKYVKNINGGRAIVLASLIDYVEGRGVRKDIAESKGHIIRLFAFDEGKGLKTHTSAGDAIVQILEGSAEITVEDNKFILSKGETVVFPSGVPHSLYAVERFKMLLTVIFE